MKIEDIIYQFKIGYRLSLNEHNLKIATSRFYLLLELLEPLMIVLIFCILRYGIVIEVGDKIIPISLSIAIGVMSFQIFADSMIASSMTLKSQKSVALNFSLNSLAYVVSAIFSSLRSARSKIFIILVLIAVIKIYYIQDLPILAAFLFLIAGCLFQLMWGISLGLLFAPFCFILSDLQKFISIALRPLLFCSGAIFALDQLHPFFNWLQYLPFSIGVQLPKVQLFDSHLVSFGWIFSYTIMASALFVFGLFMINKFIRLMGELS